MGNHPSQHTTRSLPGGDEDLPLRSTVPCQDESHQASFHMSTGRVDSSFCPSFADWLSLAYCFGGFCDSVPWMSRVADRGLLSLRSHVSTFLLKLTLCQVPDDVPYLEVAKMFYRIVTAKSRVSLLCVPRLCVWHEVGCSASPMRTGECPIQHSEV